MKRTQNHRLQCQHCGKAFWTHKSDQKTCNRRCAARYRLAHYPGNLKPRTAKDPSAPQPPPRRERMETVEAQLARATAARLRRERIAGRREHTITDGFLQRPGVTTFDRGHGLGFR